MHLYQKHFSLPQYGDRLLYWCILDQFESLLHHIRAGIDQ